jgi:hypothetical protein
MGKRGRVMEQTINDIVREVVEEEGLKSVPASKWEWEDCDKGHAECYMAICPACKFIDRDCEGE